MDPSRILEIQDLKKTFIGKGEVKGFEFTQIRCAKRAYIYEVNSGSTKYYEVFKKRLNRRFALISYPNSKAFGKWAWTCQNINDSFKKFKTIENGEL